jgi:hypothetical protein
MPGKPSPAATTGSPKTSKTLARPAAANPAKRVLPLQVIDELFRVNCLVDAAFMASADLEGSERESMRTLLEVTHGMLSAAKKKLEDYVRTIRAEDHHDDA